MSGKSEKKPYDPPVAASHIEGAKFDEGSIVEVHSMENLDATKEAMVVKYVHDSLINPTNMKEKLEAEQIMGADWTALNLGEKAIRLQKYHNEICEYFNKIVPGLIVPSLFVALNDGRLAEYQRRMPKDIIDFQYVILSKLKRAGMDGDKISAIKDQLLEIARAYKRMSTDPFFAGRLLDLAGTMNLSLTPDGSWRIIDTNNYFTTTQIGHSEDDVLYQRVVHKFNNAFSNLNIAQRYHNL